MDIIDEIDTNKLVDLLEIENKIISETVNWPTEDNILKLNARIFVKYVLIGGL